ncbi:MAG: TetR/AcrR family transcriptional regulator [Prevotella sp.]|nr:TetR/AcrR family transcriptional regulator [Prevotella sp.]
MHKISSTTEYRHTLRERILEETLRRFEQEGIRAVKMDDIAAHLSISKRTLYEIFCDKECLIMETIMRRMSIKQHKMDDFLNRNPNVMEIILEIYRQQVEELSHVNPLLYSELHKYKKVIACIQDNKRSNKDSALNFFNKGVEEGFFRSDVRYDILFELADAQMEYIMRTKFYMKYPFTDIYKNLLLVTVRGFATDKGLKILDEFIKAL